MTYFCMYAFRKPFSVNSYTEVDQEHWLVSFKIALTLLQVFGYLVAKLIGVKVIAEMQYANRAKIILWMILSAELALIFFAISPSPINVIWLFFYGLSLGMIWGLVFSYLEGRKTTELPGAVLSVTFILASGLVRTVAKWLMVGIQVSEMWMPAVTSAIFLPLLVISVLCLNSLPAFTASDQEARQKIPR